MGVIFSESWWNVNQDILLNIAVDNGEEEDDQDDVAPTEEALNDKDLEEELEDPEMKENAQLPDVDPSKIKVEKKDMSGKLCVHCLLYHI